VARLLDGDLPDGVKIIDMRVPGRIALRRSAPDMDAPGPTAQLPDSGRQRPARPL